ncbi:MAG: 6-phosphofructokinase [Oscillospiraceae bacterium]|jgi:6-phosphofructokinase 1|nr:6-phosphofructokinase [Oscillospiraceae bacterium]
MAQESSKFTDNPNVEHRRAPRRLGVLTSGGDAPGMNAAIRAVVRTSYLRNIDVIGIRRGYNGLIHGDLFKMGPNDVNGIITKGGTMLYTARSPEFQTRQGIERAADTCNFHGLDALVVIGGDGSFRGAMELTDVLAEMGSTLSVVGIPGSIDNDIACTNYTIGFDSAANTCIQAIDKLQDTMQSHERCSVVEVMGHKTGHLAVYVGIAVGATVILAPEKEFDFEQQVLENLRSAKILGREHSIVIVAEGVGKTQEIAERIHKELGMDTRVTILGHVQRGGSPTARDRVMASRMGEHAVELLCAGRKNRLVVTQDGAVVDIDIAEGTAMTKSLQPEMYRTARVLSLS